MASQNAVHEALARACVLIVDDQPANVALLTRLLRAAGARAVHAVTDPEQAAPRCLEVGADLVLLDLHMPQMDGFAVMAALRAALPPDMLVPVIVLTADSTTEARDRALDAGAKDFLTKPFDHTEVLLRVRNLLETSSLHRELRARNDVLQADLDRRTEADRRMAEERRLRHQRIEAALTGTALSTVFQPIVDLRTAEIVGTEALSRFSCEPHRPPNEWFEEADAIGRGPELECAAVSAALVQLGRLPPSAFMSVNVSPATALLPSLRELLDRFPSDRVVLELTEHAPVADYVPLLQALAPLRERGVRIAIDDAGAGYSGLRHILRLQPDIIKLDIDLTRDIDSDPAKRALGTALVAFAREIDALIIAEGIETREEMAALQGLGVACGQGYHLARPGPPSAVARLDALNERA